MNDSLLKKIDERLEHIQAEQKRQREDIQTLNDGQRRLEAGQARVETGQNHTNSALEAIAEGQKDIRRSVVKELKNHERRLTEVEDQAHSHKN